MRTGVWAWSRHPNYFGEILLWIGTFLLSIQPLYVTKDYTAVTGIMSPLFTFTLLMFLSGMPPQERPTAKKQYEAGNWALYSKYLSETSILIPMPSAIWKRLPGIAKTLLGEFPIYKFTPPTTEPQPALTQAIQDESH